MDPTHDRAPDSTSTSPGATATFAEIAWLLHDAEQRLTRTADDVSAPGEIRSVRAAALSLAVTLVRAEVVDLLPDLSPATGVATTPSTAGRTVSSLLETAMHLAMSVDCVATPAVTWIFVELSAAARDARRLGC